MSTGNVNTTVELQEPFSFALWPIIVLGILVFGYLAFLIIVKVVKIMKARKRNKVEPVFKVANPMTVKGKYLKELEVIEGEFYQGKTTARIAYQKMSMCIRHFVNEVTGIKVDKYTLSEIQTLNMPMLSELIQEYYPSEFDKVTIGDFRISVEKTKGVIEQWS